MRKLRPINEQIVRNALDFVSEKCGSKIKLVELRYIVSGSGVNILSGFNFQNANMEVKAIGGGLDKLIREFKLSGDLIFSINTPIPDIKLTYSFCSPTWDFQEEIDFQIKRGNRLQVTPTVEQGIQFENSVHCEMVHSYNTIGEEVHDLRFPIPESERLIDLITMVQHIDEIDKQEPKYQFGRQRFSIEMFIDYICKKAP